MSPEAAFPGPAFPGPASRAPAVDREVRRWALDTPAQLRPLRAALLEATIGTPPPSGVGPGEAAERMLIVVTELATNALRYGLPPTVVLLYRAGRDYLVDVVDHDPTTEPELVAERRPAVGGLGLGLARSLALDVGWYRTTTTKHVWARLPGPPANPQADPEGAPRS